MTKSGAVTTLGRASTSDRGSGAKLASLRAVGEPVSPPILGELVDAWSTPGYEIAWFDSGTSALAVALRVAGLARPEGERRVVMPAYGCPDMVSAALWAGLSPVLADCLPETPWLDTEKIVDKLDQPVTAIIAPHFVGLRHPTREVADLARRMGAVAIEDSAQLSPRSSSFRPSAGLVVLSFGRGKPIPAFGGALLYQPAFSKAVSSVLSGLPMLRMSVRTWRLRIAAQNLALHRPVYALLRRMPILGVGETRFREPRNPRRLNHRLAGIIGTVISRWQTGGAWRERSMQRAVCDAGLDDLAYSLGWDGRSSLLRYPVLAPSGPKRDELIGSLESRGLGASWMYRVTLDKIVADERLVALGELTNATDFANRFLALPVHSGVSIDDIRRIRSALLPA